MSADTAHRVLQFINQTNQAVFLTGKAGTGKTTLLKEILEKTHKNTVIVAPTGIAALNAGGVTLHSLFQLPFAAFLPIRDFLLETNTTVRFETHQTLQRHLTMNTARKEVIQNMELLIIDEVSMLRADLLDVVDLVMRKTRRINKPFGGVQVLYIGDMLQLPPVVKQEEWQLLRNYYQGIYFFNSQVVRRQPPVYIELEKIYRQSDAVFISILNHLRNNELPRWVVEKLNQYVNPDFDAQKNPGYITLTTHNLKADEINNEALNRLSSEGCFYYSRVTGEFPEKLFPVEDCLELRTGAQVMFIKNDLSPEKRYFNGKIGWIHSFSEEEIIVAFPDENLFIEVERYVWQNKRYTVNENTREIDEEILGSFEHYPLKLAWAITVHKSQGLTFDKAVLDISRVFLPGQVYVALSRLRSLDGLVLLNSLRLNGLENDPLVMEYAENKTDKSEQEQILLRETRHYIKDFTIICFDWRDLMQAWHKHRSGYGKEVRKTSKSGFIDWAEKQCVGIEELIVPSKKFMVQLERLYSDFKGYDYIGQRVKAATEYFLPVLENLHFELLLVMEEVYRMKRVKEFYNELADLEDFMSRVVFRLFKLGRILESCKENKNLSKIHLIGSEAGNYKRNLQKRVLGAFKAKRIFVEENVPAGAESSNKGKKNLKKASVLVTLELWQQQETVESIASHRKLSVTTIINHLAQLIEMKQIELDDLLPNDRIEELEEAFSGETPQTLKQMKEQTGDVFTWEELRFYKAFLKSKEPAISSK